MIWFAVTVALLAALTVYAERTRRRPVVGGLYSSDGKSVLRCRSHREFLNDYRTEYEVVDCPFPSMIGQVITIDKGMLDFEMHDHPYTPPELRDILQRAGGAK